MDGIGPEIPLSRDNSHGVYSLVTSYKEEVKQNFKNLLLTAPGERVMNPDFGVGLRHFLFEPRTHAASQIRQKVQQQVDKYMPYIRINKIEFNTDLLHAEDTNVLSIKIIYDVPNISLQASIVLKSEVNN
jgi:hypothetical protein